MNVDITFEIAQACEIFGCSTESARRSITRHLNKPEVWRRELEAKASLPCFLFNFSLDFVKLMQEHCSSPFIDGVFPGISSVDRVALLRACGETASDSEDAENVPGGTLLFSKEIKQQLRKLADLWKGDRHMPYTLISFSFEPIECENFMRYEEYYNSRVLEEGVRHLLGVLTISDNHLPFVDYCNERLCGTPAEALRLRLQREHEIVDWMLSCAGDKQPEREHEMLNEVWQQSEVARPNILGSDPATSLFRRNKYLTQRCLAHFGLHHIRSVTAATYEEAEERIMQKRLRFPVVCKPCCGEGSVLVSVCLTLEMVKTPFLLMNQQDLSRFYNNSKFVIEEYIEGEEYVVNTVSLNGSTIATDVWRSVKVPKTTESHRMTLINGNRMHKPLVMETTSLVYDSLVLESQPLSWPVKDVIDYTIACVNAVGLRNGTAHCEVRLDSKYNPPRPVLIELNPRCQGNIPRSAPLICYSQMSLMCYMLAMTTIMHHQLLDRSATPFPLLPPFSLVEIADPLNVPWPITPVYYRTAGSSSRLRKVVFFNSPITGVINLRVLKSLETLPTFISFSRMDLSIFHRCAIPRVSITYDLFTCPGGVVLEGTAEEVQEDTVYIRKLESARWSPELIQLNELYPNLTQESFQRMKELLNEEKVLYCFEKYLCNLVVYNSLLPASCRIID